MKKLIFMTMLVVLFSNLLCAQSTGSLVSISQEDFLELKIGNYVHSFNEFDTSIVIRDKQISIGIYFDISTQDIQRAEQLKKRLETQIPHILEKYEWAKGFQLVVSVWSEDRKNRGY